MKTLRHHVSGFALQVFAASLAVAACAAQATTYEVGTLTTTPWTSAAHGAGTLPAGLFSDVYDFTIGSTGTTAASEVELNLNFGTQSLLHISNMDMKLFDSSNTLLFEQSGSPINWSGTLAPLSANHIQLSGTADGSAGGAYLFAISAVAVAPVPEPANWLLLLAGLGVVGVVARRRSDAQRGTSAGFSLAQ